MDIKKKLKRSRLYFVSSLTLAIILAGFLGYLIGNKNLELNANHIPELVNRNLGAPDDIDFSLFWQAYDKLKQNYLGQIDAQKLLYGAITGAFNSVGDPYTVFLSPDDTKSLNSDLTGELEGVGLKMGILDNVPAVIAPLPGSPAQKAGLKPKDKIVKVDNQSTQDMTLDAVVARIRGKAGTEVVLTILREGETQTRDIKITRAQINVQTVEVTYQNDIAIVSINEFGTDTSSEFDKAAKEISDKNINKVVIDLRDNPGGLLDSAISVAGQIFPQDTLVTYEQGRDYKNELKTSGDGLLKNAKISVIVNAGSASAAEILAGAIKDHNRGKLIGQKTFGKGTVQQLEPLSSGSSAKITVAKWLTPNGQNIDKNGIEPDISVKEPDNIQFITNDPLVKAAIDAL